MLRLHLPPNLPAAAQRNAIPLRLDVDMTAAPQPELLPALALLQRWCGAGAPPKFIQLSRAQLQELVTVTRGLPLFVENGRVSTWPHGDLLAQSAPAGLATDAPLPAPRPKRREDCAAALQVDGSEHFLSVALPSREHPLYEAALTLLKESGFTLEPSNRRWWLRDRHKALNFLARRLAELKERFQADFTPNFERNTRRIATAELAADVASSARGFTVAVGLRAPGADEATLREAIASNRAYVEANGAVVLLDPRRLEKLARAQRTLAGDPQASLAPTRSAHVGGARAAELAEILEELSPNYQAPAAWRERGAALRNVTALAPAPVSDALQGMLRPYQKLGVAWLWHLQRHELGGILADEMGLGKTLQAIAVLAALRGSPQSTSASTRTGSPATPGDGLPALVVCPASLLENWRRECARFAPEMRVFVHHGERRLAAPEAAREWDVLITSYGTLTRDQTLFSAVPFRCVIADEAQHIKNRRSQNAAALRSLQARSRFLLTGTPVENSLEDLRSLFEFLLPGYLNRLPAGLRGEERAWHDERLRAQTAPYILRRTKRAVAPELPEKIEQVLWCELTPAQAALYRETQERSERELFDLEASGASEGALKFAALTQLLRLRQICCDPRLVRATSEGTIEPANAGRRSPYAESAKLDAFRELLEEAVDDGHRVLVFSQFTSLLALLRAELEERNLPYCYLDGSMPARARQAEVDRFQGASDIPLFLLSLKAGGTGLNLTAADTVVIFDPWWNPAVEAQATDRAHRIGQTRTVSSYKLIAAGTVEEKVLGLQSEKRALLANVFEASDALAAKLSLDDLRGLLRRSG